MNKVTLVDTIKKITGQKWADDERPLGMAKFHVPIVILQARKAGRQTASCYGDANRGKMP